MEEPQTQGTAEPTSAPSDESSEELTRPDQKELEYPDLATSLALLYAKRHGAGR